MSLRLRTVLAAAAATMLAVVVLGAGVDVLVGRHLTHELDRSLRARAVGVAQLAFSAPALLTTPGALDAPAGGTAALVEVVDRKGRIVARSLSLGGRVLPGSLARDAIAGDAARYRTVRFGGDELRVYAAPLATVSGGGAVLVAASRGDLSQTISTIQGLTIIAALLAAGVGAAAAALLLRGALQPLARLDRSAAEIGSTGDASRRLPDPHRGDEVGRLATTLNSMLESLERAREAERRFLADASHELRTPLTALRGNVEHLVRHGASPGLVADLEADASRLARLADDLLTLSREETATAPADDVHLDELAHAAGADRVDAESVTVVGDRAAIERALANLLENARRHGRGVVSVTVRADGERAVVTVEDEGRGVHLLDRERVFERFYGDGSGLGLAIVRATAERHGGRAYVEGSRFTIELLRKASESARHSEGEELEKGRP
jgi:two-component system, OmpR family, sensor kinase